MDTDTSRAINTALIFLICLMGGGVAGFMVGDPGSASRPANIVSPAAVNLNDVLGIENAWIVQGLSCPADGCADPLLNCTHPLARQVRHWVNSQLATGRAGEEITAEIISTHGSKVFKFDGLSP